MKFAGLNVNARIVVFSQPALRGPVLLRAVQQDAKVIRAVGTVVVRRAAFRKRLNLNFGIITAA